MVDPNLKETSYRGVLWANLVSLIIVLWIGVRFLLLSLEARGKMASLLALPPWYLYAVALAVAAGLLAVGLVAWVKRVSPQRPVFRLLPVLSVVLLGLHVFVVPPCVMPVPPDQIIVAQLSSLEQDALALPDGLFPAEAGKLELAAEPFSPPMIDRRGEPLEHWRVVTSSDCQGPILTPPSGIEPGTLLWCVSADRTRAWLTAVGLGNAVTGPAVLVQSDGEPAVFAYERVERRPTPPIPLRPSPASTPADGGALDGVGGAIE